MMVTGANLPMEINQDDLSEERYSDDSYEEEIIEDYENEIEIQSQEEEIQSQEEEIPVKNLIQEKMVQFVAETNESILESSIEEDEIKLPETSTKVQFLQKLESDPETTELSEEPEDVDDYPESEGEIEEEIEEEQEISGRKSKKKSTLSTWLRKCLTYTKLLNFSPLRTFTHKLICP